MKALGLMGAVAALALTPGIASAAKYVKGGVAYGFDNPVEIDAGGETFDADADNLYSVFAAIGNKAGIARGEIELNYTDIDGFDDDETGASAGSLTAFVNLYLDIPVPAPVQPFVGVGLGVGETEIDSDIPGSGASEVGFAYHVGAGLSFSVGPGDLEAGYRYMVLPAISDNSALNFDAETHQVTAAYRLPF